MRTDARMLRRREMTDGANERHGRTSPLRAIVADDDVALRRQIRDALQDGDATVIAEAAPAARRSSSRSSTARTCC